MRKNERILFGRQREGYNNPSQYFYLQQRRATTQAKPTIAFAFTSTAAFAAKLRFAWRIYNRRRHLYELSLYNNIETAICIPSGKVGATRMSVNL